MDSYELQGGRARTDRVAGSRVAGGGRGRALPAGLVVAAVVFAAGCGDGGDAPPPEGADPVEGAAPAAGAADLDVIQLEAEFLPRWESAPSPAADTADGAAPEGPPTMAIYLDVSHPMGGFVPPDGSAGTGANQFRTVVQWVADHLTRTYTAGTPAWRAVGDDVRPIAEMPRLRRSDFGASASRIDLAIASALADLQSGRSEAAALVTDLLGTGENIPSGALAVLRYLTPWLESASVRAGELHLGVLGAKAEYWGVASRSCALRDGLGCWYSERGHEWRRMEAATPAPFYVVVVGRNSDAITTVLESIRADAEAQGIETLSELFTAAARPRVATGSCTAFVRDGDRRNRQYSLRLGDDNEYACLRSDAATLTCAFAGLSASEARLHDSGDGFTLEAMDPDGDGGFEVAARCDLLRGMDPAPDLLVDVTGTFAAASQPPDWEEWSIETDDTPSFPGGTLQLKYLVEGLRLAPDFHQADSVVILRARGS